MSIAEIERLYEFASPAEQSLLNILRTAIPTAGVTRGSLGSLAQSPPKCFPGAMYIRHMCLAWGMPVIIVQGGVASGKKTLAALCAAAVGVPCVHIRQADIPSIEPIGGVVYTSRARSPTLHPITRAIAECKGRGVITIRLGAVFIISTIAQLSTGEWYDPLFPSVVIPLTGITCLMLESRPDPLPNFYRNIVSVTLDRGPEYFVAIAIAIMESHGLAITEETAGAIVANGAVDVKQLANDCNSLANIATHINQDKVEVTPEFVQEWLMPWDEKKPPLKHAADQPSYIS